MSSDRCVSPRVLSVQSKLKDETELEVCARGGRFDGRSQESTHSSVLGDDHVERFVEPAIVSFAVEHCSGEFVELLDLVLISKLKRNVLIAGS